MNLIWNDWRIYWQPHSDRRTDWRTDILTYWHIDDMGNGGNQGRRELLGNSGNPVCVIPTAAATMLKQSRSINGNFPV